MFSGVAQYGVALGFPRRGRAVQRTTLWGGKTQNGVTGEISSMGNSGTHIYYLHVCTVYGTSAVAHTVFDWNSNNSINHHYRQQHPSLPSLLFLLATLDFTTTSSCTSVTSTTTTNGTGTAISKISNNHRCHRPSLFLSILTLDHNT